MATRTTNPCNRSRLPLELLVAVRVLTRRSGAAERRERARVWCHRPSELTVLALAARLLPALLARAASTGQSLFLATAYHHRAAIVQEQAPNADARRLSSPVV